jgi:hypothetical protein
MKFAPKKYELIHFTRRRTKFNLQAGVKIEGMEEIKRPSKDIRILGV